MAAKTDFEKFEDALPLIREIRLPMVADSTAEVAVEVDTDIAAGSEFGWIIHGMRWIFQNVSAPHLRVTLGTMNGVATLQLCRGERPATPVILSRGDRDLIIEDSIDSMVVSSVGVNITNWPREVAQPAVTQMSKLYLMFMSTADIATISAATLEIFAEIMYSVVKAPKVSRESQ